MKIALCMASLVAFAVTPAFAGEGHVSNRSLSNMGLAGMKTLSDSQGMQVRGLSIAVVGGFSTATIHGVGGTASSTNFYLAAGHHSASGNNASVAGDLTTTVTTVGSRVTTVTTVNVIGAGGFSSASAGR